MRRENKIFVYGTDVPEPVQTFQDLQSWYGFHPQIVENIKASGYSVPTAVQKQAIPAMCEVRARHLVLLITLSIRTHVCDL